MAKYYYEYSSPVKQTQVVTLGCQILVRSCSYFDCKIEIISFYDLSAKICYLYKHISNQIRDYMHGIKIIEDYFSRWERSWIPS